MSDNMESLEQRVAALESELAELKRQLGRARSNGNWVDEISGSMKSFPEFEEVTRLGREFRESFKDPEA